MYKNLLISILTIFLFANSYAQDALWSKVSDEKIQKSDKMARASLPERYELFSLDFADLKSQLKFAPLDRQNTPSGVIIAFPNPEGKSDTYRIYEAPVMEEELGDKYPNIKSYVGKGIDDPTASIRFSVTLFGLHAMTLSGTNGTFFIDTYTKDLENYIVYSKSNVQPTSDFKCLLQEPIPSFIDNQTNATPTNQKTSDGKFRIFRLAMACTIEYAAFHVNAAGLSAGTLAQKKAAVLAAMNVTMTRVNGIYERDLSMRMNLIANNDLLIFIDSDNFSNTDAFALINESQTQITTIIGSANFDIGHTVSTGGGGLAGPSPCVNTSKARGITGSSSPVGDPYDIDYVAHEMGHQFGANHTFNNSCGGNVNPATAVEPGSGSTIMAYAGICAPNVQMNSDDYFHAVSIAEINALIASSATCAITTNNGNLAPVVNAGLDYTIPNGTPFVLKGSATDANGDVLTYCWEQTNTESSVQPPLKTATGGPNFRSILPTASPNRNMPDFSSVLADNLAPTWEVVPTVARQMNFALTARDNRTPNGGQTGIDNMVVTFASGDPFIITSQNVDGISWTQGTAQTITWNLGGIAVPATASVNILLSTDGGLTYPTVLAASTPNDGTQIITVPNVAAPFCRIMIVPVNNIYYAVNLKMFAIGYTVSSVCNTYSFSTPISIPESTVYTTRTLTVPASTGTIYDVNTRFDLTHTYLSDVQSEIVSPAGTIVKTFERECGNTNGTISLNFDDSGASIACGSSALQNVVANQPLSAFNGQNPQGIWTFKVRDAYTGDFGTVNSASVTLCTQTIALATEDFVGLSDFSLYPNPNNGSFTVQFTPTSNNIIPITVHDLSGRIIFENKYPNNGSFVQNIQLDHVQSGIYLISVQDENKKIIKKIVIN